jgi:phenylalanyl-tRNA synthetase beta subunit
MHIDRQHVIQVLRKNGMNDQADEAEKVLGVEVDTERDADLLRRLGIDPDNRAEGGTLATLSSHRPVA